MRNLVQEDVVEHVEHFVGDGADGLEVIERRVLNLFEIVLRKDCVGIDGIGQLIIFQNNRRLRLDDIAFNGARR